MCVCVRAHVRLCVSVCACVHVRLCVCVRRCMCMWMQICAHICVSRNIIHVAICHKYFQHGALTLQVNTCALIHYACLHLRLTFTV